MASADKDKSIRIMYLHGYGSRFDPQSDKMQVLSQLGKVFGPDLDYGQGPDTVLAVAMDFARREEPDLVIGTSMGGWLASHVGAALGIPFVALNPAIQPAQTLRKYIGHTVNYSGFDATIDADAVAAYPDFQKDSFSGLVLCEEGDEVLGAGETMVFLEGHHDVRLLPGGSHRFSCLSSQLDSIRNHVSSN
tara:strand:+ start:183443 stop:184015 length:573 start_codon:yes stop_codon:yes gene_type:complete